MTTAVQRRGIEVVEALLVRDRRWWSFTCNDSRCCPLTGTPVPTEPSPATVRYAAELVGRGEQVLPDRESLRAMVWPTTEDPAPPEERVRVHGIAQQTLVEEFVARGADGARDLVLDLLMALRHVVVGAAEALDSRDADLVVQGLHDVRTRDEAITLLTELDPSESLVLLCRLARHAQEADAAPICSVLAWVAYAGGNGALAAVAVERALAADPSYSLAALVLEGMDRMVPPADLRRVSDAVRRAHDARDAPQCEGRAVPRDEPHIRSWEA